MQILATILLAYISTCFALGIFILVVQILNQNINKKSCILYCIIFYLIQLIANYVIAFTYEEFGFDLVAWNIYLYTFHAAILSSVLIRTYHTRIAETVSAVAIGHFVSFTMGNLAEEVLVFYMPLMENTLIYTWIVSLLSHTTILLFSLLIAYILKKLGFNRYFKALFLKPIRTVLTLLFSLLIMHLHTIIRLLFPVRAVDFRLASYSVVLIFLALFILQFAAMYHSGKEKIKAQEEIILQQQAHLALLEELQQEVRAFRHDFGNLMAGITVQAKEGDISGIQDYLHNTGNYFDTRLGDEIKHLECVGRIQIYPLRGLITSKLALIQEKKLHLTLEVLYPVIAVGMQIEDFIRCIGILLDNAIEETQQSLDKKIKVVLLQQKNEIHVIVSNTFKDKPDLRKIQQAGYSTKGKDRGTGLNSYKRLAGEYPGCVTRTYLEETMFTQELRVPIV